MAKAETEVPVQTTESKAIEVPDEGRRGSLSAVPRVQHEVERLFDDFMAKNWIRPWRGEWRDEWPTEFAAGPPKIDVIDRRKEILVKAELPGFAAAEVEVSITDQTLSIKAEHREEKEEDGEYRRREISSSYVSRSVALPTQVDGTRAKAKLKDGVLQVKVPKAKKSTRRSIKVE